MQIKVQVDVEGALNKLRLAAEDAKSALPRALNKTAITARAQGAREIRDVGYGIKVSAVKASMTIRKATRSELRAIVTASGRPIPLFNYGARQNARGVSVNVLKGRKTIDHAFIATMRSGHKGVFVRLNDAEVQAKLNGRGFRRLGITSSKKHGLPIRELYGPSIPAAFKNEVVQTAVKEAIQKRFPTALAAELHYIEISR